MTVGQSEAWEKALRHGIEVYRRMLEDENQHIEDAVRTGIGAALDEYVRLTSRVQNE
jgi:hypothetical protein